MIQKAICREEKEIYFVFVTVAFYLLQLAVIPFDSVVVYNNYMINKTITLSVPGVFLAV